MTQWKNFKLGTLILAITALMVQSCSVEKRYHSSGFSVSWSDKFTKGESTRSSNSASISPKTTKVIKNKSTDDFAALEIEAIEDSKSMGDSKTFKLSEIGKVTMSDIDENKGGFIFQALKSSNANGFDQVGVHKIEEFKPGIQSQLQANNASRGSNILLGILLLIVALWFAWNISMLLGLILFFVAIFVMSSGKGKNRDKDSNDNKSNDNEKNSSTLMDVVYLKNGSIIVGSIIEQVPNENLKIQTKDGSVFVYPMTDISRITKEKR
jgi:hypothetical protein